MTATSDLSPPPPTLLRTLYRESFYVAGHAAMTLGWSLRLAGQHHMPMTGPALVIANHQSFLDPILVGVALRRPFVPLARKTLFRHRLFAALIRSWNAVPIDQEGVGKDGIRVIGEQLKLGRAVLVFPEGERTPDGAMHPFKPGVHLLLRRVQAPIVPVGIAGAFDAWPRHRAFPIPAPLCWPASKGCCAVAIGTPLDPARYAELPRDQAMRELFEKVHDVYQWAEKVRRHP